MASTYTPKLNLAKPANGDVDWHIPVNGNFDDIDSKLGPLYEDISSDASNLTLNKSIDANSKDIANINQISTQQFYLTPSEIPGYTVYSDTTSSTVYDTSWQIIKSITVPSNQQGSIRVRYIISPGGTVSWRLKLNGTEVADTLGSGNSMVDFNTVITVLPNDIITLEGHADYSSNWITVTTFEIYAIPILDLKNIEWT